MPCRVLYTRVLDDDDDEQRELGIAAGHAWTSVADTVAVYDDLGVSPGMQTGIAAAQLAGVPIEYRTLEDGS